jgi:cytochrome P450
LFFSIDLYRDRGSDMIEPENHREPESPDPDEIRRKHGEEMKNRFGRDMFNDFDIDDPRFGDNLFPILDEMLEKCPVARSHVGSGYWVVSRNADVRRIGQDWRTFSSAKGYQPNRPAGLPYLMPEESDPPKHTAWRDVLNPHLSPRAVAKYDAQIRADANTLIDRFIDRGECEFISEFGAKLPGWAFFKNVLGVPVDDLDQLVQGVHNGTFAPREERPAHFGKVFEYLGNYLTFRRDQPPRGDLVDTIAAGVEYEPGVLCPWEDRVSILVDLTFGGIATTTYVMAASLHYLATHPGVREALVDDPGSMDRAVEEFVRVFPPVVALGRTCTREVEVAGTKMKQGDFVLLNYAASSRDPRVVQEPTKIDITRESVLHSAFGVGVHRCIGSNLARLELKATFEEWLKRIPDFAVKGGTGPTYETGILRVMKQLHLVF